jgi:hypothetical protein
MESGPPDGRHRRPSSPDSVIKKLLLKAVGLSTRRFLKAVIGERRRGCPPDGVFSSRDYTLIADII